MSRRFALLAHTLMGLSILTENKDLRDFDLNIPKMSLNHNFGKTGGGSPSKHGISLKQHRKNRKNSKLAKLARRKQR